MPATTTTDLPSHDELLRRLTDAGNDNIPEGLHAYILRMAGRRLTVGGITMGLELAAVEYAQGPGKGTPLAAVRQHLPSICEAVVVDPQVRAEVLAAIPTVP